MKVVVLKLHKNMDEENYKKDQFSSFVKSKDIAMGNGFYEEKIEVWIDKNEVIDKI